MTSKRIRRSVSGKPPQDESGQIEYKSSDESDIIIGTESGEIMAAIKSPPTDSFNNSLTPSSQFEIVQINGVDVGAVDVQDLTPQIDTTTDAVLREPHEEDSGFVVNRDTQARQKVEGRMQDTLSYTNHLANVVSGINHEVSPWLGSALTALEIILMRSGSTSDYKDEFGRSMDRETCDNVELSQIKNAITAINSAVGILLTSSSNVKMLKDHSLGKSSLNGTLQSWFKLTILDRYIKEMIHDKNIKLFSKSLDFEVSHSPMYVAQIVFNLVKNAVEHNQDMLEDLSIKIYGHESQNVLIVEDNGNGISKEMQKSLFKVGGTTKCNTNTQHGLGLSACMDYAVMMNATIRCTSKVGETRFYIQFESDYDTMGSERYEKKTFNEKREQLKKYRKQTGSAKRSGMYEAYIGEVSDLSEED